MKYQFTHITSTPCSSPSSNEQTKRTVHTVKHLTQVAEDSFTALSSYRATPFAWCERSPTKLLMGMQLHSSFSKTTVSLVPQWSYLKDFRDANQKFKDRNRKNTIITIAYGVFQRSQTTQTNTHFPIRTVNCTGTTITPPDKLVYN